VSLLVSDPEYIYNRVCLTFT